MTKKEKLLKRAFIARRKAMDYAEKAMFAKNPFSRTRYEQKSNEFEAKAQVLTAMARE